MMPARSDNRLLMALAVLVVGGLLALVWLLRSSDRPPRTAASSTPAPAAGPGSRPGLPAATPTATAPSTARADHDTDDPLGEDDAGDKPMAEVMREAERAVSEAARGCVDADDPAHQGAAGQQMTIRATVTIDDERAFLDEVHPIDTDVVSDPLQDCILQRVGEAQWDVAGARPAKRRIQQSIRIGELLR